MSTFFLYMAILAFCLLLLLAAVGERALPLFDNDFAAAARFSKTAFALLGGLAFSFIMPAICKKFGHAIQRTISHGGSNNALAEWVGKDVFVTFMNYLGTFCLIGFSSASVALAWLIWTGKL